MLAHTENIEDPITGAMMSVDAFRMTYGPLMALLDGQDVDTRPDYWFEPSPLNAATLHFRNDQRRSEWIDWAIDELCIPPLRELQEGESREDKESRAKKEEMDRRARAIQQEKRASKTRDRGSKNSDAVQASIVVLEAKIAKAQREGRDTQALEAKRATAYLLLNKWLDVTR